MMVEVSRSCATLRIIGDNLDPEIVSHKLQGQPTFAVPKYGLHPYPRGKFRIAKTGAWRVKAKEASPADIDGHVEEIFSGLTTDLAIWAEIAQESDIDLFCGLWLSEENEMLSLSPRSLQLLGERGVRLELDIYYDGAKDQPFEK